MKLIRTLGVKAKLLNCRRGVRIAANELDVTYPRQSEQKSVRIKDISPTGVYLLSSDRWVLGTIVPITLKKWSLHQTSQSSLRLRAKAVRQGEDGVGLTFLYKNTDSAALRNLVGEAAGFHAQRDPLSMLRFTKALAFLSRICPSQESESMKVIRGELAYESGERALGILVAADELVERRELETRPDVSPAVINRILEECTRTGEECVRPAWAGLLASTAARGSNDQKTLYFVGLLAKLDSVQLRILTFACARSIYMWNDSDKIVPKPFVCKAEEMRKITRLSDLNHIERALDHLYELGLLEQTVKDDPFSSIREANLTPTQTGLSFYSECNGWPEQTQASKIPNQMKPVYAMAG